jgi:hypothetical protein
MRDKIRESVWGPVASFDQGSVRGNVWALMDTHCPTWALANKYVYDSLRHHLFGKFTVDIQLRKLVTVS